MRKAKIFWYTLVLSLILFLTLRSGYINTLNKKHIICNESITRKNTKSSYTGFQVQKHGMILPVEKISIRNVTMNNKVTAITMDHLDNTTIVTAYFNLGRFKKFGFFIYSKYYDPSKYHKWASIFQYILNPLVVYTDDDEFAMSMSEYRKELKSKTFIFKLKRADLWSFQLYEKICSIFKQPHYPSFTPNTEKPDYSCAMHSKFVLVGDAIRRNLFKTKYYQWLDIGLFRDIVSEKKYFRMNLPPNFDASKIAYTKAYDIPMSKTPEEIIKKNLVWVGGATFLGERDALLKFEILYKKAVEYFISKNLMNTDQQILYAIYSDKGRQLFKPVNYSNQTLKYKHLLRNQIQKWILGFIWDIYVEIK